MKMFKVSIKSFLLAVVVSVGISANANSWNWTGVYQGPSKDIITLMITSNYTKSRLLADLVQNETRQPYILLPGQKGGKIFFCPSRNKPGMEILEKDLPRFIKFCNPKQIIVIGGPNYVPQKYLKMIDPKQTVWIINNQNWNKAAESVGKFLDLTNLAYDYKRLSEEIEGGQLYTPLKEKGGIIPVATEEIDISIDEAPAANGNDIEIVTEEKEIKVEGTAPATVKEPELMVPEKAPELIKETDTPAAK
jgi:hypothetical protein